MLSKLAMEKDGKKGSKRKSDLVQEKPSKKKAAKTSEKQELDMQKAMELCRKLGEFTKVDTNEFDMTPFDQTLWRIFGAFNKRSRGSQLYSSARTINQVGARLLYAAICNKLNLKPSFNPTGCVLWEHQWGSGSEGKVRCLHGDVMPRKENAVELAPSSEMGISAIREGKGILTTNRWGRQSVRVMHDSAAVCVEDVGVKFGIFSKTSCGMIFSDSNKARTAMRNAIATTQVVFPGAKTEHLLFMPICCECNYAGKSCLGRQMCKMTPFSMPGLENIQASDVDVTRAPFVRDPAVFVFQCCNFSGSKRSSIKSCDFKISYCDLLSCLSTSRKLWNEVFGEPMPIQFPMLKWGPELQVKNANIPEVGICNDLDPFGHVPLPSSRREEVVLSSDDDDEAAADRANESDDEEGEGFEEGGSEGEE